jgi:hypothetical protein
MYYFGIGIGGLLNIFIDIPKKISIPKISIAARRMPKNKIKTMTNKRINKNDII